MVRCIQSLSTLLLTTLIFCTAGAAQTGGIHLSSVEPTVLFPRGTPLRQIALVTLNNESGKVAEVAITALNAGELGPVARIKAGPGTSTHPVLVPDVTSPGNVVFEARGQDGGMVARKECHWQPQRKWKIFVVKSSHEDLGYENYIFKKQHDIATFIDIARDLSKSKENVSDLERKSNSKFHYTMESLLFQRNYIEERGESAWRDIVEKDIKTRNMHLMGAPSGVASHWMDYEEIARMTYPGRRDARDRFGLDLKTFMIVDNPSLSWSGAEAVAEAGFKYAARWGQGWRTGGNNDYEHTKLPALFWWQAPDQFHKVLFGWRSHYGLSFWYGQTGGGYGNLIDTAAKHLSTQLQRIEDGSALGPYPYDALVNPEYVDHDIPRFDERVLPAWTEKYAYPEISIASPDQFFEYIEKKYGTQLPVLSGDLNNFSADYATIDPEAQGLKRQAARLLPMAEGLEVLASMCHSGYLLLPSLVDRTWTRMFDFVEHSWPTLPPATDVQLFNAAWVKKAESLRVIDAAEAAVSQAAAEFGKNIRTGPGETIAVFNALAHARTEIVKTKGDFTTLTDLVTGARVACQKNAEGEVVFLASQVPAYGYKLYRIERGAPAAGAASSFEVQKDSIANEYYAVRFDATTGAVKSILDKTTGKELIDARSPYLANQMVYVHRNERESKEGFEHSPPKARRMEGSKGPVQEEFDVWIDDDKTQATIRQTVILYAGLKRIDFVNRLDHARVLFSKNYEDRYRENIYYAFPFAVKEGQPRVEYPGGVVRPYTDQLRWGSHDFLYANRWVDVSNSEGGVTLVPWNAGTFHFGGIRYNQFSVNYKPENSWLFSYAWSNRMAGLLTLNGEDCNAVLGYSMTSHGGDWNSGETTRFAWSTASPLQVIRLSPNPSGNLEGGSKQFLSVDAPNVELTVLKNSEQPGRGWVARFVETHGKATEFILNASALHVDTAYDCNLVEDDQRSLPVVSGNIRVSIRPFGHATVRMQRGTAPGRILALTAKAAGDDSVALSWSASNGAAAYNVYRSDDLNSPPAAHYLVGRSTDNSFVDTGLHIKTRYYYRVAPVSDSNLQGEPTPRADAAPDGQNVTPPAPVDELGVVRRAKDTLMIYWRSNIEPDVARYWIYRSDAAGFSIDGVEPLAMVDPSRYFLQLYVDKGLQAQKRYWYRVFAEDWAGNRQPVSPEVSATPPAY